MLRPGFFYQTLNPVGSFCATVPDSSHHVFAERGFSRRPSCRAYRATDFLGYRPRLAVPGGDSRCVEAPGAWLSLCSDSGGPAGDRGPARGLEASSAAAVGGINSSGETADPDLPPVLGAPAEDRDFNDALFQKALVPFDRFTVPHGAPETRNPLGSSRWAKQSYAFVHMCLYGRGGRYQQTFAMFFQRLGRGGQASEALSTECFKMNLTN